jgi:hypothetical protein
MAQQGVTGLWMFTYCRQRHFFIFASYLGVVRARNEDRKSESGQFEKKGAEQAFPYQVNNCIESGDPDLSKNTPQSN